MFVAILNDIAQKYAETYELAYLSQDDPEAKLIFLTYCSYKPEVAKLVESYPREMLVD